MPNRSTDSPELNGTPPTPETSMQQPSALPLRPLRMEIVDAQPLPKLDAHKSRLDAQTPTLDAQTPSHEDLYPSRRNRRRVTLRLQAQSLARYKVWCFVNKVSLQDAVERAMDLLTGAVDARASTINDLIDYDDDARKNDDDPASSSMLSSGRPDAQLDAQKNDDGENSLLNFYAETTGNRVRETDRKAFAEVSHHAPHVIKAGIITSVLRAKSQIHSFKYCIGAIEEIAESSAGADYLQYLISQFNKTKKEAKQ